MTEAYLFDAPRTPRGKGKKDGSLHSVKPISLLSGLMQDMQQRLSLDTALIDDVVLGCVTPVGDQGADIAKTAALAAGWDWQVAGVQLNRFCASNTCSAASTKSRAPAARSYSPRVRSTPRKYFSSPAWGPRRC